MEDENIKAETAMGTRRPRQGEVFWGEMVTTWKASGMGARRFCREQGLAVSTFSLWRKKLSGSVKEIKPPLAVTADAAFIVSNPGGELASQVPAVALPAADAPASRDRVTLSLAGVRIELSGVHAERIVRFVLGQLGGSRC
ncbi:IS66 family insertion sequence element accessory protein TnpA [Paraburkholderia dipogonis]|uniref:IS66 family insertion sequence element accessory protein TnpA n=1 Tax=Paraburkholderia dipogonis TaxID=1211383 RepID=UPI0038BC1CC5